MDRYVVFSTANWTKSSCVALASTPRQSLDGLDTLFSIPAVATEADVKQWQSEGGILYTADEIKDYLSTQSLRWERPKVLP